VEMNDEAIPVEIDVPDVPRCPATLRGGRCVLDAGHTDMHEADLRGVRWRLADPLEEEAPMNPQAAALEVTLGVTLYSAGFEAAMRGELPSFERGAHFKRGWRDGREAITTGRARYRAQLETGEVDADGKERK
jgi:hypothetical protein